MPADRKWKEHAIASFDVPAFEPNSTPSIEPQGNVFVPTSAPFGAGAVTETSPKTARKWVTRTIYTFGGGEDGQDPSGAFAFDDQNRLFGTTQHSGDPVNEPGDIYRLTPQWTGLVAGRTAPFLPKQLRRRRGSGRRSIVRPVWKFDRHRPLRRRKRRRRHQSKWRRHHLPHGPGRQFLEILYSFCTKAGCADGANPWGLPVIDASGTLYGTTQWGGSTGGGTVYAFVP